MIGRTFSHYRILARLGAGGMGEVYRAEDLTLGRQVAVKFLAPGAAADPEARRRFLHEAKAAAALEHEGICAVHEAGEADGHLFIVMPLLAGQTLQARIAAGPLPLDEALETAAQVAEALHEAHRQGVVHRDVKPANVMLGPGGRAKVMDFGLARLAGLSRPTAGATTLGTAAYMSPEQARGDPVDRRTDIWSLGAVLYELVAGRPAFPGEYAAALLYEVQHAEPPPLTGVRTGVPPELERIVGKCLAKDPGHRYQHADELAVDLRRLQRERVRFGPLPWRRPPRRLLPALAAVAAAVVFALGAVLLRSSGGPVAPPGPAFPRHAIAVLPFRDLGTAPEHAYFACGLHDELLTQLAKVGALKVISRTSVAGYLDTAKPPAQIAAELGVGSLVEGTVQVIGERLRVSVQLVDAATDAHLWAERYDRTLDDVFAIQSEVAQNVVAAVGAALTSAERRGLTVPPTPSAEAYRLYLQGCRHARRPDNLAADLEAAQRLYEQAIALDPGFALAHAALSTVHGRFYWYRLDPSPARVELQRREAEEAARLAPDLPQARLALGVWHYHARRDCRRALAEFAAARVAMPNDAELWAWTGLARRRLGRWDDALAAYEEAVRLDPLNTGVIADLGGNTLRVMHRYAEAVAAYDRVLALERDSRRIALVRGFAYVVWQGRLDTLRAVLARTPPESGPRGIYAATLALYERRPDALLDLLRDVPARGFAEQTVYHPRALYAAYAHELRGDLATARAHYDTALAAVDTALAGLPEDWRLHGVRGRVLAGLGRRDEARAEARWLVDSPWYGRDAVETYWLAEEQARILAACGEVDAAVAVVARLVAEPSELSVPLLRLDPAWDPLRGAPAFAELLARR